MVSTPSYVKRSFSTANSALEYGEIVPNGSAQKTRPLRAAGREELSTETCGAQENPAEMGPSVRLRETHRRTRRSPKGVGGKNGRKRGEEPSDH
jgi:hypothetical protein